MDNFDFKKYLAENRIHADHDLINEKKEDSKKGNKEEQKRMEGAIRDNEIHIDKLNKDKKADEKKLAKLKKDFKKDVKESEEVSEKQGYNDRDDEAIGAKDGAEKDKKVSMKGRRDMSRGMEKALGNRPDSTDSKMDESEVQTEMASSNLELKSLAKKLFSGFKNMGADVELSTDKVTLDKAPSGDLDEKNVWLSVNDDGISLSLVGDKAISFNDKIQKDFSDFEFIERQDSKSWNGQDVKNLTILPGKDMSEGYGKKYEEDDIKKEEMSSKMKISELKAKIREDILSTLNEEEDVDVDVDFKDEVNVDAEGDEIDIVKPAVKAKVEVGLSPEEEIVQDSLKAAMDAADALGNDKLADQIGNTITFFTREYVVGRNSD